MSLPDITISWLGHSTFLLKTPEGDDLLVDPFLESNPKCPEQFYDVESDAILVTHGHNDHIADVEDAASRCDGPIVGNFEVGTWLGTRDVDGDKPFPMNKGGTAPLPGLDVEVTMTNAHHSSAFAGEDGSLTYLGEPAGYVVHFSNGKRVYIAGDTCLFSDMKLIAERWDPDLAILPIGDHFTMDPEAAAHACEFLDVDRAIPCHYGTMEVLTGRPDEFETALRERGLDTEMIELEPGESF
jgi:L-ascorbate metabolism protein UlaG (beta-lactamase superfamily)